MLKKNETIGDAIARLATEEQAEKDAVKQTLAAFDKEMDARKSARQAEQQAREQALADEAEAARALAAEQQMTAVKNHMKNTWQRSGGNPDDFEQLWPKMWNDYLSDKTQAEARQRQAAFAQQIKSWL